MFKLPWWWSWSGVLLHLLVGTIWTAVALFVAALNHMQGSLVLAVVNIAALITIGAIHEQAQQTLAGEYWSDFLKRNGGPWNGLNDVAWFTPAGLVWVTLCIWG